MILLEETVNMSILMDLTFLIIQRKVQKKGEFCEFKRERGRLWRDILPVW